MHGYIRCCSQAESLQLTQEHINPMARQVRFDINPLSGGLRTTWHVGTTLHA